MHRLGQCWPGGDQRSLQLAEGERAYLMVGRVGVDERDECGGVGESHAAPCLRTATTSAKASPV